MYRSKHDPKAPVTGSTLGTFGTSQLAGAGRLKPKGTATFGLAQGKARPNPGTFLKKQEKRGTVAAAKDVQVIPFKYEDKQKKPGIPSRDDKPVQGLQTTKNFITANAVETILQAPPFTPPESADPAGPARAGLPEQGGLREGARLPGRSEERDHPGERHDRRLRARADGVRGDARGAVRGNGRGRARGAAGPAEGQVGRRQRALPAHDAHGQAGHRGQGQEERGYGIRTADVGRRYSKAGKTRPCAGWTLNIILHG
ncbi:unnamed protein product [Heterosigma akashiwo]